MQSAIDLAGDEWQQADHLYNGNPLRTVRRPRVDDRRERRLQTGEWHRLLDAVDEKRSPLLKPLLVLARETGMRRSELLRVEWKHVDLDRCTAHLPKTKNGHPRDVPLSPLAMRTLDQLPRTAVRVLPLSVNSVRLAWQRLRRRAQLHDLRLHDLRAQCATDRLLEGWSVAEVQVQTGHRDATVLLNRYARLQASDVVAKLHARGTEH